jgi:ssRNA-specific RNase YbeY (16S rRNA maturation enzyme)
VAADWRQHLASFDHETARQAKVMEARKANIMLALGYPHPYMDA